MDKKDEIMLVNQESLAEKIYIIRGQQVQNNIEKFDDDFRFQLTKVEWENLRSKITTSNSEMGPGGRRYLQHSKKRPQQKLQALLGSS